MNKFLNIASGEEPVFPVLFTFLLVAYFLLLVLSASYR